MVIELQSQYGKFELVLNAKRLTIFMLGDRHKGIISPHKMFQEKLDAAMAAPGDRVVLSHPFVSVLQVDLPEVVTSPVPKESGVPMAKGSSEPRWYWYSVGGKRVPIPPEALKIEEEYDHPMSVFTVDLKRVPVDSPFHLGMLGTEAYRKAFEEGQVYLLDLNRVFLHAS